MRIIGLMVAILATISTAAPSPAGDGAPAGVRNCTWCHGTSGHGYANAPELAGQRHQYIENQLLDFHNHVRDNPFSQQYMWGAAANLNAQTARDLAVYFSLLPPKPANDGVGELAAIGREIYLEGIPEFGYALDSSGTICCAWLWQRIRGQFWNFAIGSPTMRRAGTIWSDCGGRRGSAARNVGRRIIGSRRGACVTAGDAVGRPR